MNASNNVPWRRLSLEAVAIVMSILLAFSIDAWWEDRQRVVDERVVLQSLLQDLEIKKVLLAKDRIYNGAILEAVLGLLRAANNPSDDVDEESTDRLIADTWWYNVAGEWDSAPMQSLVGGDLSIISSPDLSQKIAKLQVEIARVKIFYTLDADFHHNTYTPFLVANAYMPQITSKTQHFPGRPELEYEYPEIRLSTNQKHSELLRNKEFQNMLIAKMDRLLDILQNGHRFIGDDLDEVIAALEDELANEP